MAGNEQLYNKFSDEQSLIAEKNRILGYFKEVKDGILELSGLGIKLNNSASVKQTDELTTALEIQDKVLSDQQKQLVSMAAKLAALTSEEAKKIEATKQVTKLVKEQLTEETKLQVLRNANYQQLVEDKLANQQLNKEILARIKIRNAEAGSEEKMILLRDKARRILARQGDAGQDSAYFQKIAKYAEDLNNKISALQQKTGNFRNNVGNYAQSLSGLFDGVREEIQKLEAKQKELNDVQRVTGFLTTAQKQELEKTTTALTELNQVYAIADKTGQSFNKTVRQIGFSFSNLASNGNQSEEFMERFKRDAAEATDRAGDLKDEIKALASDTRKLDLAVGSISAIASGFEIASGAAALFGADNEEIQKSIQKIVAIQSVANGIRELGTEITKRGTAANKAYNYVMEITNNLFGKGKTAAERFNAALKSIVIIAVIGLLIELVQRLSDTADAAGEAELKLFKLNIELEKTKNIIQDIAASDKYDFDRQVKAIQLKYEARRKGITDEKKLEKIAQEERKELYAQEVSFQIDQNSKLYTQYKNAQDALTEEQKKQAKQRAEAEDGKLPTETVDANREAIKQLKDFMEERKDAYQAGLRNITLLRDQGIIDDLKAENEAAKKKKALYDNERKDALELFKFRQELEKQRNETISADDSGMSLQVKLLAANKAAEAEKSIILAQKEFDLQQTGLTASKKLLIEEKAAQDLLELQTDLQVRITQIIVGEQRRRDEEARASIDEFNQQNEAKIQAQTDFLNKQFQIEQKQAELRRDTDQRQNLENFNAGLKTREEYEKRKLEIEESYQRTTLQSQITFYESQLKLLEANGEDVTEALAAIAKAKLDLANIGTDTTIKGIDQEKEAIKELQGYYKDLAKTVTNTFGEVIGGIYEKRKQQIQGEIDAIEIQKAAEIDKINKTTEADELKAAKIKIIEANAQKDREALERKQRNIDRQKAIFERAFKAFQIGSDMRRSVAGINIAASEAFARTQATIPGPAGTALAAAAKAQVLAQIPFVLATGAANLVALLATPLPKYWTGTEGSLPGPAHVAEKGPELAIEPSGNVKLFEKPQIANLIGGTKIRPADVTKRILDANNETGLLSVNRKGELVSNNPNENSKEIVEVLEKIYKKSGVVIHNEFGIESTTWYNKNIKR